VTRYVALLRGINVGKNNRLPMAELRTVLTTIGGQDVATLLQSGNAVLTSEHGEAKLATDLRAELHRHHGLDVPFVVRTVDWLRKALADDPFPGGDPKLHLLAFLSAAPAAAARKSLQQAVETRKTKGGKDAGDEYAIDGDRGWLSCAINVHESLFAKVDWDKLLGVQVTMRNRDTATKLLALAEQS
jgi:uncharacterized protein (DUF1697 family)